MKRFPQRWVSKETLLILAVFALVLQMFAFGGPREAVADHFLPHIQQVFITNTGTDPVPITGAVSLTGAISTADNPALQPFSQKLDFSWSAGETGGGAQFVVPAGKRLVMETVTATIFVAPGVKPYLLGMTVASAEHPFQPVFAASFAALDMWLVHQPTTLYADPGSTVRIFVNRTPSTGGASATVHIVGHLVDVP